MEALLIGGTGFIGRALAAELLRRGHGVRVLSRSEPAEPLPAGTVHVRGDVATGEGMAQAAAGCQGVAFLAGREDVPWLPAGDRRGAGMFEVNVRGTHRALTAAREAGALRAVVVTSCATFGVGADGEPVDGTEPVGVVGLRSPYLLSRIQQELAALETAREGFRVICAGPSAVVGPGDDKFFGPLVRALARVPTVAVPRGGFNFIALDDVCVGLANLLEGAGQRPRYLFVGENMTYRDLVGLIREQTGGRAPGLAVGGAALGALTGLAELFGVASGRVFGIGAGDVRRYLDQRVYYDPRWTVSEVGMPLTPVREAIVQTLRDLGLVPG